MDYTIKPERTGWRDSKLTERHARYNEWDAEFSARHKTYGRDCPMTNQDGIVTLGGVLCSDTSYLEYDLYKPVAFVEYKNEHWHLPTNYQNEVWAKILVNTAEPHQKPAYLAIYSRALWWYRCYPLNSFASTYFSEGQIFTEREYVELLYKIRGRTVPDGISEKLNNARPDHVRKFVPPSHESIKRNRQAAVATSDRPTPPSWNRNTNK